MACVAYLLSPARYWAFFRQLTITVHKPLNMWVETEPGLKQVGPDTFKATFDGLPDGNLHLSTQLKGLYFTGKDLVFLGTMAAVGLIVAVVVLFGRRRDLAHVD